MSEEIKNAIDTLRKAMQEDYGYAWAWHCNIAVCMMDEMNGNDDDHEIANKGAARFMQLLFKIDTSKPPRLDGSNEVELPRPDDDYPRSEANRDGLVR